MADRAGLRRRRRLRRAWLTAVAVQLDEAAAAVDALHACGVRVPGIGGDIAAARMMVNALSAANGS